jgi:hypothetical protein
MSLYHFIVLSAFVIHYGNCIERICNKDKFKDEKMCPILVQNSDVVCEICTFKKQHLQFTRCYLSSQNGNLTHIFQHLSPETENLEIVFVIEVYGYLPFQAIPLSFNSISTFLKLKWFQIKLQQYSNLFFFQLKLSSDVLSEFKKL